MSDRLNAVPAADHGPLPGRPGGHHRVTRGLRGVQQWLLAVLALAAGLAQAGNLPGELPALVGRLNTLSGDVQLQDRDTGRWDSSPGSSSDAGPLRNWPVAEGDRLRLGRDARAELRIGSATLRLGAGAQLWLEKMDSQAVVLQLQDGTLALRLAAVDGDAFGPVEVRTREGRWLPRRPGHYRFDRERDATQGSVWRGQLQFEGFDSALTIPEGRRADLWLDAPDAGRRSVTRYAWAPVERDGFADWVARDERHDDAPQSARYVPPGITGWQDLDRHGDWIADTDQGPLWLPRAVPPGWAPYQAGRWAWVSPWGWTWIDAAPWGFAPFHYGVWLRFGERWAWSPGRGEPHWRGHGDPRVRYAPALGAWVGGPSVGVTVQIGSPRPPPPRIVVPTVPVVIVRPEHRPVAPVVVVPGRPERRWDDRRDERRADDRRWEDRRLEERRGDDRREGRRDDRREDRRDDRPGPRGDRLVGTAPAVAPVPPATPVARPAPPSAAMGGAANESPNDPPPVAVTAPVVQRPVPPPARMGSDSPRAPGAVERSDRHDRSDRGDRADRVERPERQAWQQRGERSDRADRGDRNDRNDGDNRRDGQRSLPGRVTDRDASR